MPWVNNPRYGQPGESREIFEHERSREPVDPGKAKVIVAVIGLVLVPWLYPALALVLAAAGGAAALVAREVAGLRGGAVAIAAGIPVVILLVVLMRVEQRLGTIAAYRWSRHAVRVMIPAVFVNLLVQDDAGSPLNSVPDMVSATVGNSSLLGGTIAVAVVAQVILWFARWVRSDWHSSLVALRMRSATLE